MSIFTNSPNTAKKDTPSFAGDTPATPVRETPAVADFSPSQVAPPRPVAASSPQPDAKESLIAADLTIEGKIQGSGHVRIAGKFKGDVDVQGNLRIENGAKLNGGVKAKQVVVAGELEGNIDSASKVELLDSAVLVGDVKTGTLIVNAGSKIRGHVECGWDDKSTKSGKASESDAAS
ncbi:MAG: polymer-forming cytoskeletal protein [Proteobacteria bacterium]|nr:polymer-forming cytoskeletal protein [Pseudomonadota bacterium]